MTMTFIQSQVMTNSTTQFVGFNSIPQTFTHLQIRCFARATANASSDYIAWIAGGSSTYSNHQLYGNGSSALATGGINGFGTGMGAVPAATAPASVFGVSVLEILDYTNTNKLKVMRCLNGFDANGSGFVYLSSGMDSSTTTALTGFSVFTGSAFAAGSRFDLYGIGVSAQTGA